MANVRVDISAIKELQRDLDAMMPKILGQLAERGARLLREEVPYQTGNLRQGVSPPDGSPTKFGNSTTFSGHTATITVTARSARRGARQATLHLKSGKSKAIQLRATKEFNYAEIVAHGRPAMTAKNGRAFLIEARFGPIKYPYIEADGKRYVVVKSVGATAPNPYDQRAADRLQKESTIIVENIAKQYGL
jgi:hypothetical protein